MDNTDLKRLFDSSVTIQTTRWWVSSPFSSHSYFSFFNLPSRAVLYRGFVSTVDHLGREESRIREADNNYKYWRILRSGSQHTHKSPSVVSLSLIIIKQHSYDKEHNRLGIH